FAAFLFQLDVPAAGLAIGLAGPLAALLVHGLAGGDLPAHGLAAFAVARLGHFLVGRAADVLHDGFVNRPASGAAHFLIAGLLDRPGGLLLHFLVARYVARFVASVAFLSVASLAYRLGDRLLDGLVASMPALFQDCVVHQFIAGTTLLLA